MLLSVPVRLGPTLQQCKFKDITKTTPKFQISIRFDQWCTLGTQHFKKHYIALYYAI